jgi:hypothetical protein
MVDKELKRETKMKLYVWENPYEIRYGYSLVFVVAENLRKARKQATLGKVYGRDITTTDLGKPTRIVKLPCAEWHSWEE